MNQVSLPANVIPFPKRNKGRIRKSTGARSEGLLAVHQFNAATGGNLEVFNQHRGDDLPEVTLLGYFLEKVFNNLPADVRTSVKRSALCDAALGDSDTVRVAGALVASMIGKPKC